MLCQLSCLSLRPDRKKQTTRNTDLANNFAVSQNSENDKIYLGFNCEPTENLTTQINYEA